MLRIHPSIASNLHSCSTAKLQCSPGKPQFCIAPLAARQRKWPLLGYIEQAATYFQTREIMGLWQISIAEMPQKDWVSHCFGQVIQGLVICQTKSPTTSHFGFEYPPNQQFSACHMLPCSLRSLSGFFRFLSQINEEDVSLIISPNVYILYIFP